jgi:DNA-binding transcriptional ArsR family regulator
MGRWILTGSQEAPLMRGVTESLAGRAAALQLLPLSTEESSRVSLLRGGFPEVVARPGPKAARLWFASYVQTCLERDVRAVSAIRDLSTFRRLLGLLATRTGQILNKTDLAAPLGVSVPTITEWLSILEITGQIALVPPYFESFGKRIVKSPKLFLLDPGRAEPRVALIRVAASRSGGNRVHCSSLQASKSGQWAQVARPLLVAHCLSVQLKSARADLQPRHSICSGFIFQRSATSARSTSSLRIVAR